MVEGNQGDRKKKSANGGNRREQKLKKEIKKLRQIIAKTRNELYKRKRRMEATNKEKEIIKELRVLTEKNATNEKCKGAKAGQAELEEDKVGKM